MAVRTEVIEERNLMIHYFSEYVSLPSVLQTIKSVAERPQYKPGMSMIWYCEEGTTIDFGSEEPKKASDLARKFFDSNGEKYKLALVAIDDLPFGLLRTYEGWSNDRPVDIHVFRTMDEAMTWIDA